MSLLQLAGDLLVISASCMASILLNYGEGYYYYWVHNMAQKLWSASSSAKYLYHCNRTAYLNGH